MSLKHTDSSALSLILYYFQFDKAEAQLKWDDDSLRRLSKIYEMNRLLLIDKQIENYFSYKDVDLNEILPSMNKSVVEKEILLSSISQGIKLLALSK